MKRQLWRQLWRQGRPAGRVGVVAVSSHVHDGQRRRLLLLLLLLLLLSWLLAAPSALPLGRRRLGRWGLGVKRLRMKRLSVKRLASLRLAQRARCLSLEHDLQVRPLGRVLILESRSAQHRDDIAHPLLQHRSEAVAVAIP